MKLSFDKIKEITFGAVRFVEKDGFLFPKRCTAAQEEIWGKYIPDSGKYSKMTTGVRLDFHTDSGFIRFKYPTNDTRAYTSMKGDSYELLVNGTFVAQTDKSGSFEYRLPEGENRVTLYFPIGAYGAISELELEDGASCTPYNYKRKFMFFGDSITQGFSSYYSHLTYACQVSQYFDADFLNQAVGCGDFFPATFDSSIDFAPEYIFIAFGTNDWSHFPTLEILKKRCSDYLDAIKATYPKKKIFGLTPLWRADENAGRAMGSFAQCCDVIRKEFDSHGITAIEGYPLVPNNPKFFFDEYLHPNVLGFSLYAQNLIKEVQNYI